MRSDDLRQRCDDHLAAHPIAAEMAFANGYLTLGAGTRLAEIGAPLDEPRLAALLTSAQGGPIEASRLTHVRRAVEIWRDGDRTLALTHLALSRLAKLGDPLEGARRLFLADALMNAGVAPEIIIEGLTEGDRAAVAATKYSPDQPRVPAGSPDGGEWTRCDGTAEGQSARVSGVQMADASATRGSEILSDATPPNAAPKHSASEPIRLAQDMSQSCADYIAANCKASILRVFPGQYLTQSLLDVVNAAKQGDPAARRAKKLLFDNRFAK
jgi:hypothetical protein